MLDWLFEACQNPRSYRPQAFFWGFSLDALDERHAASLDPGAAFLGASVTELIITVAVRPRVLIRALVMKLQQAHQARLAALMCAMAEKGES
jgi:hypothetical protein